MTPPAPAILLVEDNEDDIFLMERALQKARISNPLKVARDGREAIDYLAGRGEFSNRTGYPLPAFLFLDLNLPYVTGIQVLEWIRSQDALEDRRVFILTSSSEPADTKRSRELGVDAYLVKPPTANMLLKLEKIFEFHWLTGSILV